MPRASRCVSLLVLASSLAACGGGNSSPSTPSTPAPTPVPAPVTTVIRQGSFSGLSAGFAVRLVPFTTPRSGKLEIIVDWTFARNDLDIYLFRNDCTIEQLQADQCDPVVAADSETAKPERLVVESAAAGTYTAYVVNFGPDEESLSYQILLTSVGTASSSRSLARISLKPKRPLLGAIDAR
jgi:hypothetical protein